MMKWRAPMKCFILRWGTTTRQLWRWLCPSANLNLSPHQAGLFFFQNREKTLIVLIPGGSTWWPLSVGSSFSSPSSSSSQRLFHQKTGILSNFILECYSWASSRENVQRRPTMSTSWCRQTLRKFGWATICDQSDCQAVNSWRFLSCDAENLKKSNSMKICDGSIQTGPIGKSYLYKTPDRSLMVRVKLKSDN